MLGVVWFYRRNRRDGGQRDKELGLTDMIEVAGVWLPSDDTHFARMGDSLPDYQRPQHDYALGFVRDWSVAVDGGAHVGLFARRFARCFGVVHAFEPADDTRECLCRNVPENVIVHGEALGAQPASTELVRTLKNTGGSFVWANDVPRPDVRKFRRQPVKVVDLDSYGLTGVGLIKLDVQGSELAALRGAVDTIRRCKPVVLIEEKPVGGPDGDFGHVAVNAAFLQNLGLEARDRVGADRVFAFP